MARILVVDDHPWVAAAVRAVLRKAGHQVTVAYDGRSAVGLIDGDAWDLVVTDVLMPELDGIELLGWLKAAHPQLPVIAMSGGNQLPVDLCLGLASGIGAWAVLRKPFEDTDLLSGVDALLKR